MGHPARLRRPGPRSALRHPALWLAVLVLVGIYGGYFGAGVGIIALAVLGVGFHEPLPVVSTYSRTR